MLVLGIACTVVLWLGRMDVMQEGRGKRISCRPLRLVVFRLYVV